MRILPHSATIVKELNVDRYVLATQWLDKTTVVICAELRRQAKQNMCRRIPEREVLQALIFLQLNAAQPAARSDFMQCAAGVGAAMGAFAIPFLVILLCLGGRPGAKGLCSKKKPHVVIGKLSAGSKVGGLVEGVHASKCIPVPRKELEVRICNDLVPKLPELLPGHMAKVESKLRPAIHFQVTGNSSSMLGQAGAQ